MTGKWSTFLLRPSVGPAPGPNQYIGAEDRGTIMDLFVQLIFGAVGGSLGGLMFRNLSLTTVGNCLAGIVGGCVAGQLLRNATSIGNNVVGDVAGGFLGGIVVLAIVGFIKNALVGQQ